VAVTGRPDGGARTGRPDRMNAGGGRFGGNQVTPAGGTGGTGSVAGTDRVVVA